MPRAGFVVVVPHAVAELLARVALLGQKNLVVVLTTTQVVTALLVEEHVVEADAVPLRVDVELSHGIGLVAGVPEGLGHRGQTGHG